LVPALRRKRQLFVSSPSRAAARARDVLLERALERAKARDERRRSARANRIRTYFFARRPLEALRPRRVHRVLCSRVTGTTARVGATKRPTDRSGTDDDDDREDDDG